MSALFLPEKTNRVSAAHVAVVAALLLVCTVHAPARAGTPAVRNEGAVHLEDYRTCEVCRKALDKSFGYVKANLKPAVLDHVWYAEMLGSFYGGFAFLMEGNSQKEAQQCAEHICKYFDWAKHHMGYEGWFCSMSMAYLTEYSLRYGATPEIKEKLEWGAKWAHKTREKEGGWFHGPRWGQGNYALDISSVGCGYFMALEEMKVLGLQTGPALDEARDYVGKVCDGKSVAYGLWGKGGFSLGASGYILIGLTSSGQSDDPRVAGIGGFLKEHYRDVRKAHACGFLQHFGVAAALHRTGPEAYGPFAQYYLHGLIIPNMRPDGTIGTFPNDNSEEPTVAYAKLKEGSDYVSTAVLACMLLLERPGTFTPGAVKKRGSMSNKDAFRMATDAQAKGELGKAYKYFAEVLPLGDAEELVPQAREQMKKIEEPLRKLLKEIQGKDAQDIQQAKALEEAQDIRGAIAAHEGVIKAYDELAKQYAGVPVADDAKTRADALRKAMQPLKMKLAYGGGGKSTASAAPAAQPAPAEKTAAPAAQPAAVSKTATPAAQQTGKLRNPELLKVWEGKLKDRVQSVVKAGGRPRCDFKALSMRLTIVSMDDQGGFQALLEKGGQMEMKWAQLQPPDLRTLALDLAATQATPADHALAAFYLLYFDDKDKADGHLQKAGDEAAAVREAFAAP
ncbi:MAG: hypothetical protein NTW87_25030 [Planctomycetota bacterium]|nr:hypothetical protein [Planctomycetota bacterium]